jgi:hypothetical protein
MGHGISDDCLRQWSGRRCTYLQGPETWTLLPSLPLDQAPVGRWVVHQDGVPEWLAYGTVTLKSDASTTPNPVIRVDEDAGLAVVDGSGAPVSVGPALLEVLRDRIPELAEAVQIEVEPTPRWTVQDAVSICASAYIKRVRQVSCRVMPADQGP